MTPIREDAVEHRGRYFVPTTSAITWISSWADFKRVGGVMCWSQDQTEIELSLPVGHKFSIDFQRAAEVQP